MKWPPARAGEARIAVVVPQNLFRGADGSETNDPGDSVGRWTRGKDCNGGRCQTNLNGPAKGAGLRCSSRQLTPFGQGGRTILFEDVAAVEVTVEVEVIVDRGVGGGGIVRQT